MRQSFSTGADKGGELSKGAFIKVMGQNFPGVSLQKRLATL